MPALFSAPLYLWWNHTYYSTYAVPCTFSGNLQLRDIVELLAVNRSFSISSTLISESAKHDGGVIHTRNFLSDVLLITMYSSTSGAIMD